MNGTTNGQIQPCKYCKKVNVTWDFRIKTVQKQDGSFYKGYWKEVDANGQPEGQVHTFERCKGIQDGTIRVEEFNQNQAPVGQKTTEVKPQQQAAPQPEEKFTPTPGLKQACDLEREIYNLAKIINSNRQGYTQDTISQTADRILEIYKLNVEREQLLIKSKILNDISIHLQKLGKI